MQGAMHDRYFQAIEAGFETRSTRSETVDLLQRRFSLTIDQASDLYEQFIERKRSKYRRYLTITLLSGLASLVGLNVLASTSDQVSISLAGTLLTIIPAIFFSPFLTWAVVRTWRSNEQTVFEAVRTIAVYTLVIWTFMLHLGLVFALFAVVVDFQ